MTKLFTFACFVLLLFSTTNVFTQKLSIEDAVTGRNGELYPDRPDQLNWLKSKSYFSIVEGDSVLVIKDVKGKTKQRVHISQIKKNEETKSLTQFPSIHWVDDDSFWFKNDNGIYSYSIKDSQVRLNSKCLGDAQNLDYHSGSKYLAFTIDNNLFVGSTKEVKNITQNEDKNIVSGQSIHRQEFGIVKGTFWSPSGKKLAFYQKDESKVTEYPLVDYSTKPASLNAIKYPMAGQSSEMAKVGVVNMENGKTTFLEYRKELGPEHYLTNLAWSPDGSKIYIAEINRGQNEMHLNEYDAENGFYIPTVMTESHPKYIEPEHAPIFLNDGNSFLWFSERDGFNHIYLYSTDGQSIKQLSKGQFPITSYLGKDAKEKYIFVEATGENPLENHIYKLSLKGEMTKISIGKGEHHAELSDDGSYLIDYFSNPETPFRCRVISNSGKPSFEILNAENPLVDVALGKTEIIEVKSADGTTLYGRLIYPLNFDPAKKYPVLTYVYNGPHVQLVTAGWMNRASLWMHSMAAEGYFVWTLDGRGSDNRGRDFEQAIYRNVGTVEMEDQLAGVRYLKSLAFIDSDRMGVHGWSYGGFMTTSLMLRQAGVYKVGVAGGPVIDWNLYEVMYTERYMDTPQENPEGYKTANLTNYVENLRGDLLMIHGTEDDVVVMQHNMNFLKSCIDKGVQVDFFVYPGHPHNVRGKDRVHLMNKVLGFIMEKL